MSNPPPARLPPAAALAPVERKTRTARGIALAVALAADAVQLALVPFFGEGIVSPLNDALDAAVAVVLIWLLGFHWVLVPAAVSEVVPGLDLAPTWTASVLFIVLPAKWRWWVAAGAVALLCAAGYAVFALAHG